MKGTLLAQANDHQVQLVVFLQGRLRFRVFHMRLIALQKQHALGALELQNGIAVLTVER